MGEVDMQFEQLVRLAEGRAGDLQDSAKQYQFFQLATAFQAWLSDKEAVFASDESLADNSAAIKKRYEKHFQEMTANKARLDEIDQLAQELLSPRTAATDAKSALKAGQDSVVNRDRVKTVHQDIMTRWDRLNKLKIAKEKKLADSSSIERFAKRAQEAKDQLEEKRDLLAEFADLGFDQAANAGLITRHKNLLRDLDLLRKRVGELDYEGRAIKEVHPSEAAFIDDKLAQLHKLLDEVSALANKRDADLENKRDKLALDAATKKGLDELEDAIEAVLSGTASLPDSPSRKRRPTLGDISDEDIAQLLAQTEDLEKAVDKLLEKNPNDPQLLALKAKLKARREELEAAQAKRKRERDNAENLRKFLSSADQLLTKLNNVETRLGNLQPAETPDQLRAQLSELESAASKLEQYSDNAEDLADRGKAVRATCQPVDVERVDQRLRALDEAVVKAKSRCHAKRDELESAAVFAKFKAQADELAEWLAEKRIAAEDQSHRDLANLPSKKQRHRAFESELAAHKPTLEKLRKDAADMKAKKHPKSPQAQAYMDRLEKAWQDLEAKTGQKGAEIDEALQEQELLRELDECGDLLDKLDKEAGRTDDGKDLRSARNMLDRQKSMEASLAQCGKQLADLAKRGDSLAKRGHYDADKILQAVHDRQAALDKLQPKMDQRRAQLEEALAFRQLEFDKEREAQWIDEHTPRLPQDGQTDWLGRSLDEAQMLKQKHANLQHEVDNHRPAFDKVLSAAKPLADAKGRYAKPAAELADNLRNRVSRLDQSLAARDRQLQAAVAVQQYSADLGDIDQRLADCTLVLSTLPEAKDPAAVDKNLKKLAALEEELGSVRGQLADLGKRRDQLGSAPELDWLVARHADLEAKLAELSKRSRAERKELTGRRDYSAYLQDVSDAREWIDAQLVTAASQDFGTDFDHCKQLQAAFDQFAANVAPGQAKVAALTSRAEALISGGNPNAADILKKSRDLEDYWGQLADCVDSREKNLAKALEIHEYNKDVSEFCQRLDEKKCSIPTEVGRDLDALDKHTKKHALFVEELGLLDESLQQLRSRADDLKSKLDKDNAERVADRQQVVEDKFEELDELQKARVRQLEEAHDFFAFMKQKQAIKSWIDDGVLEIDNLMSRPVQPDEIAGFCDRATEMSDQLRNRLGDVKQLAEEGESLCDRESDFSDEIGRAVDDVINMKETVEDRLNRLADYLACLRASGDFADKTQPLVKTMNKLEHRVSVMPDGSSLEQVAKLSQELDALRAIYDKNSPRLEGCREAAANAVALMRAGHPLLEQVKERLKSTEQLVSRVGASIDRTRAGLADQRRYLAFVVDNIELGDFIKAQQALVVAATTAGGSAAAADPDADKSKSEQLRQLQDRKDAVDGHRDRIEAHIAYGREMVAEADKPAASAAAKSVAPDVSERVRQTADEWAKLQRLCAYQEAALESARTFLRFLEECDKAQAALLNVKPLLDSYKSDQRDTQLDNYLYDALQQLTVDQERIDRLKTEAAALMRDRPADDPDAVAVRRRCDKVGQLWDEVRPRLALCRQELAAKVKFHRFCNTADQLHREMARLTESLAKAVPPGRCTDPKSVGELIKRNNAIRDTDIKKFAQLLVPLKEIMEEFQAASIYPQTRQTCADLESELEKLRGLCAARDRQLQDERRFAAFVDGVNQFCDWAGDFEERLTEEAAQASLTSEAVEQRQARNRDRETEVDRQLETAEYLRGRGADLAGLGDAYAEAVAEPRERLESGRKRLKAFFNRHSRDLDEDAAYVSFLEAAQRLRRGLQSLETRLRDPGALPLHSELRQLRESLDDCRATHDERLASNRHLADYESEMDQLRSLADAAAELNDTVDKRHAALDKLTAYLQHCDNYQSRLDAKRVTIVEPFDEADVNRKLIEKFATLQTEVQGYGKQLDQLAEEGKELSNILEPQNCQVIEDRLKELRSLLATADERCSAQLSQAREAYAIKQLLQRCEDLDQFCQNSEDVIEANSALDSLARAKQAQKDLAGLQADLNSRQESLAEVESGLAGLKSDRARAQFERLSRRFSELRAAAGLHGENIQHAVKVFRFLAEAQDEIAWIASRTPLVDSADVGASSADVQRLTRRLKQFEEEFENRRQVIHGVLEVGQGLLDSASSEAYRNRSDSVDSRASGSDLLLFREDETRRQLNQLQAAYSSLTRLTKGRAERLEAARVRFAYLDDLAEAKSWIEEKLAAVRTLDPGADQFVCLSRCKTVETLAADVEKVEERVAELAEVASRLDEQAVFKSQAEVQNLLDSLTSLLKLHKRRLDENLKYFAFKEQVDEFDSWLRSQEIVLKSIEAGSDEESCERAIEKCGQAQSALRSRQSQMDQLDANFAGLQSEKNCRLEEAKALRDALKTRLANVHLSARDLHKSLLDSKKIHKLLHEAGGLHEALDETLHELQSLAQFGITLTSNEELLRGLDLLTESELRPLGQRRDNLAKRGRQLMDEFKGSDAETVINEDVSAVERLWQELTQAAEEKRADLMAAKEAHTGLLKFSDLLQALQQLLNQILAEDLAPSYKLAVEQVERSAQRGKEAKQRESQAQEFARVAAKCRRDCPFMSDFIDAKQAAVAQLCEQVVSAQKRRHELYVENADIRRVLDGCQRMNRWLDDFGREFSGCAPGFEYGLEQLEVRGKRSEELAALLSAQKPRVDALTELTLLERRFEEQRRTDSAKRSKSMAYNELTAGVKKRETMRQQQQPHTPPISEEVAARSRPQLTRPQSIAEESAASAAAKASRAGQQPTPRKPGLNKSHTFNTKKSSGSKSRSRLSDLMPPSIEGELEIRQDLQAGGQKFPIKKWKKRFAALCGHQLAVFKDKSAHVTGDTAQHTLMIHGCRCEMDAEHRHALRLHLRDGSLYLLMLPTAQDCLTWQGQISFKASLDPSRQLADIRQEADEDVTEGGGAADDVDDKFDADDTTVSLEVSLRGSGGASGIKHASVAASPRPASHVTSGTPPASPAAAAPVPTERKSATLAASGSPRAASVAGATPTASVSTASSGKSRAAQLRAEEGGAAGGKADGDSSSDEGESAAQDSKDKKKSSSLFRMFSGRKKKDKDSKKGGN
ncbi:hypothetical protein BOX15_Mlig003403g3 [Macrostomum lignano]|uniref:PH domain-containing protein n=1 Tax=Macrostomum lignano TaxID=282301 RepID=A0A267G340_9PLAT|nr:hypothetical protein BOX15_Mlig003403g3 [Macrostomum lignano]